MPTDDELGHEQHHEVDVAHVSRDASCPGPLKAQTLGKGSVCLLLRATTARINAPLDFAHYCSLNWPSKVPKTRSLDHHFSSFNFSLDGVTWMSFQDLGCFLNIDSDSGIHQLRNPWPWKRLCEAVCNKVLSRHMTKIPFWCVTSISQLTAQPPVRRVTLPPASANV